MEKKLRPGTRTYTRPRTGCPEKLNGLKKIIQENPGTSQVILHLVYEDNGEVIIGVNEQLRLSPLGPAISRIKELIDGAEVKII
ncbi:MAG: hypothetical protein HS130_06940 [Deltaproteobacteria bacterium]|nr:hypothetical protein [Deltaproteobacteria bacterium]